MDQTTQKIMFSSKNDEWETPSTFYNKLNNAYHFTLDPCATHENHTCVKYYTVEEDGLSQSWKNETVFINPPYSNIGAWIKKAAEEYTTNGATAIMLMPARTDTKYWHDYIMKHASTIYFIKGRLTFGNAGRKTSYPAPFPSVVVVFGGLRWGPGPRIATMER